jgi:imidazole glycerol-phosphate synthase subunit HisH
VDVTIVDCGIGNVKSVLRMFQAVDVPAELVSDPAEAADARRLVLPGVGAFDAGMAALNRGWRERLDDLALERCIPILGICLGMQLLCRGSEEGQAKGLGWIGADVRRIDTGGDARLKIPHMGWAEVRPVRPNPLIPDDEGRQRFYHVHSFRAVCDDAETEIASATYGTPFTTAVRRDNIFGVQFHPEKSHRFGMALMRRFATIPC